MSQQIEVNDIITAAGETSGVNPGGTPNGGTPNGGAPNGGAPNGGAPGEDQAKNNNAVL